MSNNSYQNQHGNNNQNYGQRNRGNRYDRNQFRNNRANTARGSSRRYFQRNSQNRNSNKEHEEENSTNLSYKYKEPQHHKEFKISLGGNDTEKQSIPIYSDEERDETLFILIEDFNMLVEDGDLFKEDEIGAETARATWGSVDNQRDKLQAIKEVYRKFKACLKGQARDKWVDIENGQGVLTPHNYAAGNRYSVRNFFRNQKLLVKECLDKNVIEDSKTCLQNTKKQKR